MKENIDPEVSLILLKKRISKLKRTIRMRVSNKDVGKNSKIKEISDFNKSTEKGSEKSISNYKANLIKKKSTNKIIVANDINKEVDRYRILTRKKYLYDYR